MNSVRDLFVTRVYAAAIAEGADLARLLTDVEGACAMLHADDTAGRAWCRAHGYGGYTSYGSLNDLPTRVTAFGDLKRRLDRHARIYAETIGLDLGPRGRLTLDGMWVNILRRGAAHSGHIHPHSVISGTVYVATPPGAGALRFEDPRLPMMMAAPNRRADVDDSLRTFVSVTPAPGQVMMWESWLRHEVTPNHARSDRVSVSFNYSWS